LHDIRITSGANMDRMLRPPEERTVRREEADLTVLLETFLP